jgi:hypothetical protein
MVSNELERLIAVACDYWLNPPLGEQNAALFATTRFVIDEEHA